MSKWQESCLQALMESPSSYKVFERSQYNRQAVVQYRTKLFPMHITPKKGKTKKSKKVTPQQAAFNKLKEILLEAVPNQDFHPAHGVDYDKELGKLGHGSGVAINDISDLTELRLCPLKLKKYYTEHHNDPYINKANYNTLCEISFKYNTDSNESSNDDTTQGYRHGDHINIASFVRNASRDFLNENSYFAITKFSFCNGINYLKERIASLLDSIGACLYDGNTTVIDPTSKTKGSKIKYCNFGIEIEYEGTPVPNSLKPQLLELGAVDFHSGIDGNSTSVEELRQTPGRLYEVRLRIDGFRGLPALYFLVDYMLNSGCIIPTTGSIHCHVDHKWDISLYKNRFNSNDLIAWILEKSHTEANRRAHEEVIRAIFKFPSFTFREIWDKSQIRRQSNFTTFEYRFLTPLLNYKSIVADIITVSHMSKCFKLNIPLNLELLKKIDIAKKRVLEERPHQSAVLGDGSTFVELPGSEEPVEEVVTYPFREIIENWRSAQLLNEEELQDFAIATRIS